MRPSTSTVGRLAAAALASAALAVACVPPPVPPPPGPPPGPQPIPDLPNPPTLTRTAVVSGQGGVVWDVAFLADGTMFFDLRSGPIRVRLPDGTVQDVVTPADVRHTGGEGGMLGLAVDPDFATNRFLYACYSASLAGGGTDNRLVRFTVNATLDGVDAALPIVTGMPHNDASGGRHSGCRPRFAPGTSELFVGTGDAAAHSHPQDPASLGGKVLRIDRDGNGLAGNPGVDTPASGFDPRVFTRGHRNVQGIGFRPGSSQPFAAEHGPTVDDELNRLTPGANYGWRPLPPYDESVPMTDHTLAGCPCTDATWSSGSPTVAPSGMTFLDGAQWKGWDGAAVVVLLKNASLGSGRACSASTPPGRR